MLYRQQLSRSGLGLWLASFVLSCAQDERAGADPDAASGAHTAVRDAGPRGMNSAPRDSDADAATAPEGPEPSSQAGGEDVAPPSPVGQQAGSRGDAALAVLARAFL